MAIKGIIAPDHIQNNKFQFVVPQIGANILAIRVSGLEEELDVVDLPDRTAASGGRTKPTEFEIDVPLHHSVDQAVLENWFQEGKDPVLPDYKKIAMVTGFSQSSLRVVHWELAGVFVTKRATNDLELDNDGDMGFVTWTLKADFVNKISQ